MELFIIRHGESMGNIGKSNDHDCPLSERGQEQAAFAAECFRDNPLDVIVSSPYTRALMTAQPMARNHGLPIHVNKDAHENSMGAAAPYRSIKDLQRQFPETVFDSDFHPEEQYTAGFETGATSLLRAYKVLNELLTKYRGKRVAIFGHAGFNTNLHLACSGQSRPSNVYMLQNNTCLSWFTFRDDHVVMLNYFGDMQRLDWKLENSIFVLKPWND